MDQAVTMDKVISLAKRRGFVFQGSEIYGGLANSWDYGPLGVELKNNIKKSIVMAEKNILDSIVDYESQLAGKTKLSMDRKIDTNGKSFNQSIAEFERELLTNALKTNKTTRSIASYLKMSQSQVARKLTKHDLTHLLKRKMTRKIRVS